MIGEDIVDDLQERENALARELASEDGGFGRPVNHLTDLDERPSDSFDESKNFTESGMDTDSWSVTGNNNDGTDENDVGVESNGTGGSRVIESENFDGGEGEVEQENYDGEEDEESEDDEDEESSNEYEDNDLLDGESGKDEDGENNIEAKKRKDYDGVIKWKPGDKITIELLGQIWDQCRLIDKIRSLIDAANKAVSQALNTLGPNLMLRLNEFVNKMTDATKDTISSLLDLASRTGKRMVYLTASTVEAVFDQQWTQTAAIATLPTMFKTAIETDPVKSILNRIFKVAVPIINRAARKNN